MVKKTNILTINKSWQQKKILLIRVLIKLKLVLSLKTTLTNYFKCSKFK